MKKLCVTFTHCYGHALNLAAGDTIKKNKVLCNTLDATLEISKLIKFSPRRDAIFQKLKLELAPVSYIMPNKVDRLSSIPSACD